jgi:hypothetical protein
MPEGPKSTSTAPFAGSCARLAASAERLEALLLHATRRCAAVASALARLPASVDFDPFAPLPVAPGSATQPTAAAPRRQRAPGGALPKPAGGAPLAASLAPPPSGKAAVPRPGGHQRGAGTAPASRPPTTADGAPQDRPLSALGQQAGALVADLLARSAPPGPPARSPASPAARAEPPQTSLDAASARFAEGLQNIVASVTGRPPRHASAPARQALRPLPELASITAPLVRQLLEAAAAAPPPPTSALAQRLPQAGPLLAQLLAGLGPTRPPRGPHRASASPPPMAPRARSHLTGPTPGAGPAPSTGNRANGPAGDAEPGQPDGESLARDLNRLLLDQAWLRGVDLT